MNVCQELLPCSIYFDHSGAFLLWSFEPYLISNVYSNSMEKIVRRYRGGGGGARKSGILAVVCN